jgi:hypothetical protein
MASAEGKALIVGFRPANHPAKEGLQPGQCSLPNRGLYPNEPNSLIDETQSPGEAQNTADDINQGRYWTFWVWSDGKYFYGSAYSDRETTVKPTSID